MCWSTGREPMAQPPGSETVACAEARQQRAQHQDGGAHGLDQLVGRLGRADARRRRCAPRRAARRVALGRARPCGAAASAWWPRPAAAARWCSVTGSAVSSAAHSSRQGGVLGAGDQHLALQGAAAADEEFVHGAVARASQRTAGASDASAQRRRPEPPAARRGPVSVGVVDRRRRPAAPCAAHSAGVSVFIDSAWICSRILSPSAA